MNEREAKEILDTVPGLLIDYGDHRPHTEILAMMVDMGHVQLELPPSDIRSGGSFVKDVGYQADEV